MFVRLHGKQSCQKLVNRQYILTRPLYLGRFCTVRAPSKDKTIFSPFMCSFLPSELEEVQQCLFADSLVTVSDTGRELGEFCINIQKTIHNNQPCFLVHANSHGAIDNIPCGTSITGESRLLTVYFLWLVMTCAANKKRPYLGRIRYRYFWNTGTGSSWICEGIFHFSMTLWLHRFTGIMRLVIANVHELFSGHIMCCMHQSCTVEYPTASGPQSGQEVSHDLSRWAAGSE